MTARAKIGASRANGPKGLESIALSLSIMNPRPAEEESQG